MGTLSTAPGPRFDSQKGQIPYSMDFLEPDNLNIKVSRNPEVGASAGHQLFVSDIRPLLMSPAECERLEGRTTYAVPKSVNYQVGNYDREPGSNLNPRDTNRETGHRVTPDMRHTVIPRTWSLGSKVSYPCQPSSSCVPRRFIRNGNIIKEID